MPKKTKRNTLIGASLAIVFLAGIFAVAHFSSKSTPAIPPTPPARVVPPKAAAAKVQSSFIGRQKIGDWLLTCTRPKKMVVPAGFFPKGAPRTVVLPRCVMMALLPGVQFRNHPYQVMIQLTGPWRRLAVIVQLPGLQPSDTVAMHLSTRSIALPVLACARPGVLCLVGQVFDDPVDIAALGSARNLAFVLPAGTTYKLRTIKAPAYGFPESFATILRVEHASGKTAE